MLFKTQTDLAYESEICRMVNWFVDREVQEGRLFESAKPSWNERGAFAYLAGINTLDDIHDIHAVHSLKTLTGQAHIGEWYVLNRTLKDGSRVIIQHKNEGQKGFTNIIQGRQVTNSIGSNVVLDHDHMTVYAVRRFDNEEAPIVEKEISESIEGYVYAQRRDIGTEYKSLLEHTKI